jgi:hypothetical protein
VATIDIPSNTNVGYVIQGHLQDDEEINLNVILPLSVKDHNADIF